MTFQMTVNQWGNGLGVRLPKVFRETHHIKAGDVLDLSKQPNGEWVIKSAPIQEEYDLQTLLKEHAEYPQPESFDDLPMGKELI